MIFYTLDYVIEKTLKQNLTAEQMFLKKFTGSPLSNEEAQRLFERIEDHKWYVSERLGRDVGLKVAMVDFLENIYEGGNDSTRSGRRRNSRRNNRNFDLKVYDNLSLSA
ncbi:MAG TPA: DUF4032 domain-containing protein [Pyrinomonadaceae bacterium]|jgi:hypothetical protein